MAENVAITPGSGDVVGADDILSVKYQRVKVIIGADGVNDGDVASGNPLPVTGTITAVTAISNALPAGTNNIGDVDVVSLPALPAGTNNIGDVDVATLPAITGTVTANAGTNLNTSLLALEAGGNLAGAATSLAVMDDWDNTASDGASVSGDVAHDGVDAGEPVKVGAKAVDLGATPTAVASNDRTNLYAMRNGIQFVLGGHPNIISKNFEVTAADGAQTDADILGVIGVGTSVVVTKCSVTASNANTVNVSCRIGFGGVGGVPAPDSAGIILYHPGIAPGSGVVEGNGMGIIGHGASGEELRVTCGAPTSGAISIVVTYFTVAIG